MGCKKKKKIYIYICNTAVFVFGGRRFSVFGGIVSAVGGEYKTCGDIFSAVICNTAVFIFCFDGRCNSSAEELLAGLRERMSSKSSCVGVIY